MVERSNASCIRLPSLPRVDGSHPGRSVFFRSSDGYGDLLEIIFRKNISPAGDQKTIQLRDERALSTLREDVALEQRRERQREIERLAGESGKWM